jgi:hypothetical protein
MSTEGTPKGLGVRGCRFWIQATSAYELQPGEQELLLEICRILDELELLATAVATEGATVTGSTGQTRVHPALSELRGSRLALGRLLDQLGLPDLEGEVLSVQSARAQRAAQVRWANHIPRGRRGASA